MVYAYTLNTAIGTCYLATYTLHFADYACFGHLVTEAPCIFFISFVHVLVLSQLLTILLKESYTFSLLSAHMLVSLFLTGYFLLLKDFWCLEVVPANLTDRFLF